ncbi:hypothetical protein L202_04106 [Cryptococcus amylolentus CBS 6039]|uniref:Coenzyme Q-binding protein COQ10 START domain-containing protein n=1 Tax=Cryptococcus amylolentus CBS 6039 TaxID=1295533 RepID=A0A1E3HQ35_9TREE|nr:hypothetical protein L202_04106 [Cryptococcus amylolentus CBS 6039]ODN78469.1 hypothetical protein L202_04106 [Cryptococcus amylolentus CBS 6039]
MAPLPPAIANPLRITARSARCRAHTFAAPAASSSRHILPSAVPSSTTQARSFFSLPDLTKIANLVPGAAPVADESGPSQGVGMDGEVQKFHARKIMPYSQKQLYSLVSDVPSYYQFIPFCQSSTVLAPSSPGSPSNREWVGWKPQDKPFEVLAELAVGFGGLEERYVSKVVGTPYESVIATASNQTPMFKTLTTSWSFSPASTLSPHPGSPLSSSSANSPRVPNSTDPADPSEGPTLLTIDLAFCFINPLHRIASQAVLPKVAEKMVEAFEERCVKQYGKGTQ